MGRIKSGMTFKSKIGKKGRIGERFDQEQWDNFSDPEWYVHFEDGGLKILSESTMRTFTFDTV